MAETQTHRILRRKDLKEKVGYSHQTVWRMEREGRFPKRITLGKGAVGWIEAEVDAWIKSRMEARG